MLTITLREQFAVSHHFNDGGQFALISTDNDMLFEEANKLYIIALIRPQRHDKY